MKTVAFDLDDLLISTKARKEAFNSDMLLSRNKIKTKENYDNGLYLHLDEPLPFALATVKFFENMGYEIVYVTGRRVLALKNSMKVLSDMGFPIKKEHLFFRPMGDIETPEHKRESFLYLMDKGYDIKYFFDDKEKNLEVALSVGIPNVYNSVQPFVLEAIDWEV